MEGLWSAWDFIVTTIGHFLNTLNSHWYLRMFLYITVLSIIVGVIMVLRGDRNG